MPGETPAAGHAGGVETCLTCQRPVVMMAQVGTGRCSSRCDPARRTTEGRAGSAATPKPRPPKKVLPAGVEPAACRF